MNEIYEAIKTSAIRIRELIQYDDTGYSTSVNTTGDTQLKIDIKSDLVIEEEFRKVPSIKEIISEEKENKTSLHDNGIYTIGYAERHPIATNKTEEGRQKNGELSFVRDRVDRSGSEFRSQNLALNSSCVNLGERSEKVIPFGMAFFILNSLQVS